MERRLEGILGSAIWLVLLVALVIALPVILLGEVAASDARSRLADAESRAVALSTRRAATQISDRIKTLRAQVETVTQRAATGKAPPLASGVEGRAIPDVQAQLATLRALISPELPPGAISTVGSYVLDAQGRVLATEPLVSTWIGSDLSVLPAVPPDVLGQKDPVAVSPVFAGTGSLTTSGQTVVCPTCPNGGLLVGVIGRMADPGGRAVGALVLTVSARILSDPILGLLPAAEDVYVVDAAGRLIVRASRAFVSDDAALRDLRADPLVAAALSGTVARSSFQDPFGRGTVLATSANVPETGWHLLGVARPSVASDELESTLTQQRAIRVLLVTLLLGGSYVLARSVRRTLRQRRRLAEANVQIVAANNAKSQFLANMSHELRTPLNAVIGFSEVLTQRLFGELNEKQAEYVGDITSSGKHLLALINDVLDLAKVEAGKMVLDRSEFSLREALATGITMIRERATSRGIALSLDVAPQLDVVSADERKVRQILFNLLSNALKFTPDGGRIDVTARGLDRELQVAVRDSGVGIAAADLVGVFEEFGQTKDGRNALEGTGLGLTLTKKLVELHGGRIWVESVPGAGSTFTFALPQAAENAAKV